MNEKTRPAMAAIIEVFECPNGDGTGILAAGYAASNRGMMGERPLGFGHDCHVHTNAGEWQSRREPVEASGGSLMRLHSVSERAQPIETMCPLSLNQRPLREKWNYFVRRRPSMWTEMDVAVTSVTVPTCRFAPTLG